MKLGTIVNCRERDWVLIPSDNEEIWLLRPLTGTSDEVFAIHKGLSNLIGYELSYERIIPSSFPHPDLSNIGDIESSYLLWLSARLTLRDGATPFRSLGKISIRPRTYQFVPLLMALRLDPIRLFIADDVGIGKTIEALLIARELFDRGEIKRFAVLCPPYLCEQWAKEVREKFNLSPVVIRSGTVSQLERKMPTGRSIYEFYPFQIISIDWVKSDRNKYQFLQFCPELIIVDEVHGAAEASERNTSQQQRHRLLKEILSKYPQIHMILLTATPHSGIETAFKSLLGLLNPEFQNWDVANLRKEQIDILAKHFVQRTRKDIEEFIQKTNYIEKGSSYYVFPKRITIDETYELSIGYKELFKKTYDFCAKIVETGQNLEIRKRKLRYWGALALLRCVMSSPASAKVALQNRLSKLQNEEIGEDFSSFVYDLTEERTEDETPIPPIDASESTLNEYERQKMRELYKLAEKIYQNSDEDRKLRKCIELIRNLLKEKYNPIIWCRYVDTAEYVAEKLKNELSEEVQVLVITGRKSEDERLMMIGEITHERPRVLVATDCLSEGINLQEKFNAVIHYDLPWNPNRMEQREGRVDRYGQLSETVKAIRFYGRDNPVDGVVIDVLLNKAKTIHKTLGIYVPVPEQQESVLEAIFTALFMRSHLRTQQLSLFENEIIKDFHTRWDRSVEREKTNRTRFAQRTIKSEEVTKELEKTDKVLGDPEAVQAFVLGAFQRLGIDVIKLKKGIYKINLTQNIIEILPDPIKSILPENKQNYWIISFESPTSEDAEYISRNHPLVVNLANYLLELALSGSDSSKIVSRCSVISTKAVKDLTVLLLLRVRYLLEKSENTYSLMEEVLILGYTLGLSHRIEWLNENDVLRLFSTAKPDRNLSLNEKEELAKFVIEEIGEWNKEPAQANNFQQELYINLLKRAEDLYESHKRIRRAVSLYVRDLKITPNWPPDLLGIIILQPAV